MTHAPTLTATYRLQLRREFPLAAARALVPYFHRLGISHLYLSPVLAARPGSPHGYDVVDPERLNPYLGTEDDLRALADELHRRNMGIILDIVPNHMAASEANPWWDDVLQRGRSSRYADWFDIDWDAPRAEGRVVIPILGDTLDAVLAKGEIRLRIRDRGARLEYSGRTFPLDGATLPKEIQLAQLDPAARSLAETWPSGPDGARRLRALLAEQHFRLVGWRENGESVNYRRFFDVNDLVALRMESEAVFDATHRLERLQRLLTEQDRTDSLRSALNEDRLTESGVKLGLIARLLRFRREHCSLFTEGDYLPLSTGALFSFARQTEREVCISVTRTRSRGSITATPRDIVLPDVLAGRWESVLTGRIAEWYRAGGPLQVRESELIPAGHPCELLFRAGT